MGGACAPCATGTYTLHSKATACTPCPENADSPQGSNSSTACACNAGYTGANGDACLAVDATGCIKRDCCLWSGTDTITASVDTITVFDDASVASNTSGGSLTDGAGGMSPLPIIGGALGGVALIAAAFCCWLRRRKRDSQESHHDVEETVGTANQGTAAAVSSSFTHSVPEDTDKTNKRTRAGSKDVAVSSRGTHRQSMDVDVERARERDQDSADKEAEGEAGDGMGASVSAAAADGGRAASTTEAVLEASSLLLPHAAEGMKEQLLQSTFLGGVAGSTIGALIQAGQSVPVFGEVS